MTIYTAIFGDNYDDLKEPMVITPGWKYICFTDQELISEVWEVRKIPEAVSPRRLSKLYKIRFDQFIDDELSIWVDASFIINCDLNSWVARRHRNQVTLMKHPRRNCAYQEAAACILNKRDRQEVIQAQISRYRRLGLPAKNGMCASGIIVRSRTERTIAFVTAWYQEIVNGSVRDQIAYGYAAWKHPLTHLTNYDYRTGTDFLHIPHLRSTNQRKKKLLYFKENNIKINITC